MFIFAQNLRTIPASAEEQNSYVFYLRTNICNLYLLKYLQVVNKTAPSAVQLANCILLQALLIHIQLQHLAARAQQKLHTAYFTSWYNSIFGYKLRTIEAENP